MPAHVPHAAHVCQPIGNVQGAPSGTGSQRQRAIVHIPIGSTSAGCMDCLGVVEVSRFRRFALLSFNCSFLRAMVHSSDIMSLSHFTLVETAAFQDFWTSSGHVAQY